MTFVYECLVTDFHIASEKRNKIVFTYSQSLPKILHSVIFLPYISNGGVRGGIVVEALRYKPEGRVFHFRWCDWIFH
jgi:hypothetical protein